MTEQPNHSAENEQPTDPVLAAFLNAPIDDEPWTEDDERELRETIAEAEREGYIPLEQVIAELGLDNDAEETEWRGESNSHHAPGKNSAPSAPSRNGE